MAGDIPMHDVIDDRAVGFLKCDDCDTLTLYMGHEEAHHCAVCAKEVREATKEEVLALYKEFMSMPEVVESFSNMGSLDTYSAISEATERWEKRSG